MADSASRQDARPRTKEFPKRGVRNPPAANADRRARRNTRRRDKEQIGNIVHLMFGRSEPVVGQFELWRTGLTVMIEIWAKSQAGSDVLWCL